MKKSFKKTLGMWALSVVGGIALLIISPWFFDKWVGGNANISWELSGITLLYICMVNLNSCVTFLLNGLNIIRVQIWTSLVFTVFYLIAVLLFGNKCGVVGIVSMMTIAYMGMIIVHFYQCHLILNGKASGIWIK